MRGVLCIGELLVDFISMKKDVSLSESEGFIKNPGGAPANVAAGVSRLDFSSGFIGKVGGDPFGEYLRGVLDGLLVDTRGLIADADCRTTLSFIAQRPDGVRDCMFYRDPGADMMLRADEISQSLIEEYKILHYGSISLGNEPCKSATLTAIDFARKGGLLLSYDPNLRLSLWKSEELAKKEINGGFRHADFVKISGDEFGFITGCETAEDCAKYILDMGAKLVVVTLGGDGCYFSNGKDSGYLEGFRVNAVETTGAGDAFVAAFLVKLLQRPRQTLFDIDCGMLESLRFANAAGALATTKIGAIPALPRMEEVLALCGG